MLVADAKDFSSDRSMAGIAILAGSAVILFLFMYAISGTPAGGSVLPVLVIGSVVFLGTLFLFLKGRGMILHSPLRLTPEGILIQGVGGFHAVPVPYDDMASLELWWNLGYRRTTNGCSVLSYAHGSVTSVETFDKDSLRRFVDNIKPILEKKGLKLRHSDDDGRSAYFAFQRDVKKRDAGRKW